MAKQSTASAQVPTGTGFWQDFHREATANGWQVTPSEPTEFGKVYPWPTTTIPAGCVQAIHSNGTEILCTAFTTAASVRERLGHAWQRDSAAGAWQRLGTVYQVLAALGQRDTSKDVHRKRTAKAQPLTSEMLAAFTMPQLRDLADLAQVIHSKSTRKAQLIQSLLDAQ